jgi:hypothetical protein
MKHEIEAVLHALETIMTEVDLELWQWQADIDMLVFAGQSVPLVLWTEGSRIGEGWARLHHDDSALTMVAESIQPAGELFRRLEDQREVVKYFDEPRDPLPLVMYKDGKREEIGFAEYTVLPNGDIVARGEVTKFIPELHEPVQHFSMGFDEEGEIDYEGYEARNRHLPQKSWAKRVSLNIDNHPFFKEDNNGS